MPELVSSTKITEQTDDGSGCIGIEKKLREERKKHEWQWGTGINTSFFFLLRAEHRGKDSDKGGIPGG